MPTRRFSRTAAFLWGLNNDRSHSSANASGCSTPAAPSACRPAALAPASGFEGAHERAPGQPTAVTSTTVVLSRNEPADRQRQRPRPTGCACGRDHRSRGQGWLRWRLVLHGTGGRLAAYGNVLSTAGLAGVNSTVYRLHAASGHYLTAMPGKTSVVPCRRWAKASRMACSCTFTAS